MKKEYVRTIIQLALAEDIGAGDITTDNLVPSGSKSHAQIIAKERGVLCGIGIASQVFKTLNSKIIFRSHFKDGQRIKKGSVLADVKGSTRALLTGERVALNFLSYLSGIATTTKAFVDIIKPHKTAILDTRKTTPLLRQMERYAVQTGGGVNHRFNLHDMSMVKDNHRLACAGLTFSEIMNKLRKFSSRGIEIEVDDLVQLKQVLLVKPDIILLDNMTPSMVKHAVKLRNQTAKRVLLEASGGITLKNIKAYAATGVERISIGALTHSRCALDISMDFFKKHDIN